jgi:hypothetical protein
MNEHIVSKIFNFHVTCIGRTWGGELEKDQVASDKNKAARHQPGIGASGRKAKAGRIEAGGIRRFSGAKPPPQISFCVRINTSRVPLLRPTI